MHTARALLGNGLGRYEDALAAAREAAADPLEIGPPKWALAEAVEAACAPRRPGGQRARATVGHDPRQRYGLRIGDRGGEGRMRDDRTAEGLYQEAIERLRRTRIRVELARTQLLYGEWLRRQGRRARCPVAARTAYEALTAMGASGVRGSGGTRARGDRRDGAQAQRRDAQPADRSRSPHRAARRRRADHPEIAAALYISSRTVEWHLRKVFTSSESRAGDSCDGCVTATRPCEA